MNPLNHVAIIMDGNGRWGIKYKNSRNAGHKAGIKTVEKINKSVIINNEIPFKNLFSYFIRKEITVTEDKKIR